MKKNLLQTKWFWFFLFVVCLISLQIKFDIFKSFPEFIKQTSSSGPQGYFIFIIIYIISTVMMIPGSPLTFTAGALFGFWKGLVIVSIGSTVGAGCAFLISRFLIRNYIKRKFQNNERFKSIDDGIKEESWKIVILARLSPVIPFFILNYALGITKIRFFHFIIASWIGMIPGTMTYVLMGSMGKAIVHGKKSLLEWGLLGIGIIATVFVSILISKIVKKS